MLYGDGDGDRDSDSDSKCTGHYVDKNITFVDIRGYTNLELSIVKMLYKLGDIH